jgi:hypothetical protein
MSTWPNMEDSMQFERAACAIMNERPHTISSGMLKYFVAHGKCNLQLVE